MDQKLTDYKTIGSESQKRLFYSIDSHGNTIEISNINPDKTELICWSVDGHDMYKSIIVYSMDKNSLKGLADFLNNYLETK